MIMMHLPSDQEFDLTSPYCLCTTAGLIALLRTCQTTLRPITAKWGRRAGVAANGTSWNDASKIDNFSSATFRIVFRFIIVMLGINEFRQSPEWWFDTRLLWENYLLHEVSSTTRAIYLLQFAHHMDDLLAMAYDYLSSATLRKDVVETTIHHLSTVLLLLGSSHCHYTRIGTIVSTLHAFADLPKDMAKMSNQVGWKNSARFFFVALMVVWVVTRLYIFPFYYLKSAIVASIDFYSVDDAATATNEPFARSALCFLLIILQFLNVMWFGLMLKILYGVIVNDENNDPRSGKVVLASSKVRLVRKPVLT